jgi:hypothetical protein
MFAPAQQKRLLQMAGPVGTIVLSLNSSAIYLGQAAAGIAITIAGQQEGAPGVSAAAVESAQHWSD